MKNKIAYSLDPVYKRAYVTRTEIKSACNNPNHDNYKNNGALGITYNKLWHNFENFLDDVGNCPSSEHILVRIDLSKNWCKENCKWEVTGTARLHLDDIYVNDPQYKRTYFTWNTIQNKCFNTNHPQFQEVGGKGISCPERWKKFVNFLSDMGMRPSDKHSLQRFDKSGDYCPENCHWTTDASSKTVVNVNHDKTTYSAWCSLKGRCDNSNNNAYIHYGGRGITYSEQFSTYEGFFAAVGKSPGVGYSLDRIDVNGNYCAENCRWTTADVQTNNTRRNIFLEYNGKRQTVSQWAQELGVSDKMLYDRIKWGWSTERVLTERSASGGHLHEYDGVEYTIKQIVEKFGITDASIRGKLKRGKTLKQILDAVKVK